MKQSSLDLNLSTKKTRKQELVTHNERVEGASKKLLEARYQRCPSGASESRGAIYQ